MRCDHDGHTIDAPKQRWVVTRSCDVVTLNLKTMCILNFTMLVIPGYEPWSHSQLCGWCGRNFVHSQLRLGWWSLGRSPGLTHAQLTRLVNSVASVSYRCPLNRLFPSPFSRSPLDRLLVLSRFLIARSAGLVS